MEGSKSLKERISFKSKRIREMLSIKKKDTKDKAPNEVFQAKIDGDSKPANDPATQEPAKETESTGLDTDITQPQPSEQCAEGCGAVEEPEIAPVESVEEPQPKADEGNPPPELVSVPPEAPPESLIPSASPVSQESGTDDAAGKSPELKPDPQEESGTGDAPGTKKELRSVPKTVLIPMKRQLHPPKCRNCMRGITGGIDAMFYNICGARQDKVRLPVSTGITSRPPSRS